MTMLTTWKLAKAVEFAYTAHRGQMRKYTGDPYIVHPISVATRVALYADGDLAMIIAAYLHDVLEDCEGYTAAQIESVFGPDVAELVVGMTNTTTPERDGNRATRKTKERKRLAACSGRVQTIKCCDLLDNLDTIVAFDPAFAQVFLDEATELCNAFKKADEGARSTLRSAIKNGRKEATAALRAKKLMKNEKE